LYKINSKHLLWLRSPSKSFKVIIVGGSIAELSLALMLEKNGIDFLMLEGYPSIATQVGASLALLPNGQRILDQLGC
jgi:2-polyprenyl-6-methoxyphenol hydroxylase-like FAD-dependent oxidoreductase